MEKIIGSESALDAKMAAIMVEFGYNGGKARVICKCESIDDANQKAKKAGLGDKWFEPDCCVEVREKNAVDFLNDSVDMAICVDGKNFLAIDSEIREKLLR